MGIVGLAHPHVLPLCKIQALRRESAGSVAEEREEFSAGRAPHRGQLVHYGTVLPWRDCGLHVAPIGRARRADRLAARDEAAGACSVMSPFCDLVFEQVTP